MGCAGPAGTVIAISSPTSGQTFSEGDTLNIRATLTAAKETPLHGYQVYIYDQADQSSVFEADEHVHETIIDVDQSWVISVSNTTLKLEIVSINDHDGNTDKKTIEINVN